MSNEASPIAAAMQGSPALSSSRGTPVSARSSCNSSGCKVRNSENQTRNGRVSCTQGIHENEATPERVMLRVRPKRVVIMFMLLVMMKWLSISMFLSFIMLFQL